MKIVRPDLVIFLISKKSFNYGDFLQMISEKLICKKGLILKPNNTGIHLIRNAFIIFWLLKHA